MSELEIGIKVEITNSFKLYLFLLMCASTIVCFPSKSCDCDEIYRCNFRWFFPSF